MTKQSLQDYLGSMMIGKRFRFRTSCIVPLDVTGTIKAYKIHNSEIIFSVDTGTRIVQIGEKHPNLTIEPV